MAERKTMTDICNMEVKRKHDFETKKKIVLENRSRVFKEWAKHSAITKEEFVDALEWVCDDPLDEYSRLTRGIGLEPTGLIRFERVWNNTREVVAFYNIDNKKLWDGAVFEEPCENDRERLFANKQGFLPVHRKLYIGARDRI